MKQKIIFIIFIWIWFAQAKTILVKNAQEISDQLNQLLPGDTLIMRNGYWKDQRIEFKGQGSEAQPIVLKAQTPGQVWLTGQSNLRIGGQYVVVDGLYFTNGFSPDGAVVEFRDASHHAASHCRLTNSAIVDFNPPSKSTDYKWVSLYGQYNRVDHCYFAGKNHQGTTLVVWMSTSPDYHRIDHNHFGPRPVLGSNGGETIRIGTSDYSMYDSYATVEWNYFEHCDGEIEIISNKSCKNTYRYNTFESCKGTLTLRHGNACDVYANFFFGHNVDHSGGVRIIGEDHRVYNNYFQDLQGTGYRAAISMMNGVPNSPLNRYFQVQRAQVLFNTIVNCYQPLVIGAGADEEKTLPPKDCVIANNTVLSSYNAPILTFESQPINMIWEGNIFYGPDPGFESMAGISIEDPLLQLAADGLYRPAEGSPLIGAAQDSFAFVSEDMDGQPRSEPKDVGADQKSSQPVVVFPLSAGDVGPDWYPPQAPPVPVITVREGPDSLRNALNKADDGDIIQLITDGGQYTISAPMAIAKNITIRAAESLTTLPIIKPDPTVDSLHALFYWTAGKRLNLQRLKIDGMHKVRYLFENEKQHASLSCDSLFIVNSGKDFSGAVFWGAAGSLIDSLLLNNTSLFHGLGKGLVANVEAMGSGKFNINYLQMENCTAWDFSDALIDVYGGDDVPFTPAPQILVNHCTFYRCAWQNGSVIHANEADFTTIKNSIFSNSNQENPIVTLYGPTASADYCDFYLTGQVELNRDAQLGSHIWQADPLFQDADAGNFDLQDSSYFWGKADDGYPLGDLRWTGKVMGIENGGQSKTSKNLLLVKNFPNPFNDATTIQILSPKNGLANWQITDICGRMVDSGQIAVKANVPVHWQWNGRQFASGVYFFGVKINGTVKLKKLLLMR